MYEPSSEGVWIDTFASQIRLLKSQAPSLQDIDLVVEGGVGTGLSMNRVIRNAFPQSLYLGMELLAPGESVEKVIPETSVWAMKHNFPRTVLANCFDNDLIRDMMAKTDTKKPLLFSVNALAALDSYWLPGDCQKRGEYVPIEEWFSNSVPYVAHIHLERNEDIWRSVREQDDVFGIHFKEVAQEATSHGWQVFTLNSGFAVVRPSETS